MAYLSLRFMMVCLVVTCFRPIHAQTANLDSSILSGIILDDEMKIPVPYASIVIDGSNVGTSSTEAGSFSLSLSKASGGKYLRISSLGYSTVRLKIDSLQALQAVIINLKPLIIELDAILVQAKRMSASDFVTEAIQSLKKNMYQGNYLLEWYSKMVTTDSTRNYYYSQETVFDDYHIGGHSRPTIRQQREAGISPLLVGNPKDSTCSLLPWFELGLAQLEDAQYGVFNLANINEFSFSYEGILGMDGDSVYVVAYEAINPRFKVTGSTNRNIIYKGKVYIAINSHAVLRHTLERGIRNLIKDEVLYKNIGGYYFPYYVKSTRNLPINRNFKPLHSNTFILRNVILDDVEYEEGYDWCRNRAPYDKGFWEANYPFK